MQGENEHIYKATKFAGFPMSEILKTALYKKLISFPVCRSHMLQFYNQIVKIYSFVVF